MISATWTDPLDPLEIKDYTLLAGSEMTQSSDVIETSTWSLDATAIAAGVEIHSSNHDDTTVTVWLKVAVANQLDAIFDDPGTVFTCAALVVTVGGRTLHWTVQFTVRRK